MTDVNQREGIEALKRLVLAVQANDFGTHSVQPIYEFLAGLYCDDYAPSMWRLCTRVGDQEFQDVLATMQLIRATRREPHNFFKNGSEIWRHDVVKGLRPHRSSFRSRKFDEMGEKTDD